MNGDLKTLRLKAMDLWCRYGFSSGDPFDFEDRGPGHDDDPSAEYAQIYDLMDREMRIDVLELLIREHLLPAIETACGETVRIERVETPHGPLRDARYELFFSVYLEPPKWEDVFVDVPPEAIMDAVGKIRTSRQEATS